MIVSIIAFGVFVANFATSYGAESGPVGVLKFYSSRDCDDMQESDVKLDTEIIPDDDEGDSVKVRLETPVDISTGCGFEFISDKWKDGDWQTNVYNIGGEPFGFINTHAKKIWDNIRNTVEPKIASNRVIAAGTYEGVIRASSKDIEVPQILYGRFQVTIRVTCSWKEIICKIVEFDSIAK